MHRVYPSAGRHRGAAVPGKALEQQPAQPVPDAKKTRITTATTTATRTSMRRLEPLCWFIGSAAAARADALAHELRQQIYRAR